MSSLNVSKKNQGLPHSPCTDTASKRRVATHAINSKKVFNVGTFAVQKPSAQIARMCQNPNIQKEQIVDELTDKLRLSNESEMLIIGIRLMILYGIRVSEMLLIHSKNVYNDGSVYVKGLKGSSDRLLIDSKYTQQWIGFSEMNMSIGAIYSRFYVYRLFKKIGYYEKFGKNTNNSVTHRARHEKADSMYKAGIQLDNIRKELGQKSIKSTEYYVNKSRKYSND
jgi:site-specific recombinase XerD